MELVNLTVMYGHLEGTEGKFARDPSGYLSIEAGIFRKHGLEVSWRHVQGTEARYQTRKRRRRKFRCWSAGRRCNIFSKLKNDAPIRRRDE